MFAILGLSLLAHLPAAYAAPPLKFTQGYQPCYRNCAQIQQVGNSLVITLVDKSGKAFKVASYDIDQDAADIVVAAPQPDGPFILPMAPTSAGYVTTMSATATSETATQIIVATFIYYYVDGKLVDTQLHEKRFQKPRKP